MKVTLRKQEDFTEEELMHYAGNSVLGALTGKVHILAHFSDEPTIHYEGEGDWIDLKTAEEASLSGGEFSLISLGVSMQIPEGYEAHLLPRSSTFKKYGIFVANGMGIIDNNYCGTNDIWKLAAYATRDVTIPKGTRLAQFRFVKTMEAELFGKFAYTRIDSHENEIVFIECAELPGPDRGGFGSTGN